LQAFIEINTWIRDGDTAKEQAERIQTSLRKFGLGASNACKAGKGCDNSFHKDAVDLIYEAAAHPLWRKRVVKPKDQKTPEEKIQESDEKLRKLDEKEKKEEQKKKRKRDALEKTAETPATTRIKPPRTPERRDISPEDPPIEALSRMTPSKKGDKWQSTWQAVSKPLSPDAKKLLLKVLTRTFSHTGANDALDMATMIIDDHVNMELITHGASAAQINNMSSPAKSAAALCRNMWENDRPKLLLKVQYLHNYLLLSKDLESLEVQARSIDTPFGKLFAKDRGSVRRRTTNDRTAGAFVLDHVVSLMYPNGTSETIKTAKARLTRDRDMAQNVACFVRVFGMGILPLMFNSSWRSA
jgi:hypothetical protein